MNAKELIEMTAQCRGPLDRCADDEPVFVLRARDPLARLAVQTWVSHAEMMGVPFEKLRGAKEVLSAMHGWVGLNASKMPD